MMSPVAIASPLFRALDMPLSFSEIHLMCGYFSAYDLRSSTVPSTEPPSMIRCSLYGWDCPATASMQRGRKSLRFRVAVTMDIFSFINNTDYHLFIAWIAFSDRSPLLRILPP